MKLSPLHILTKGGENMSIELEKISAGPSLAALKEVEEYHSHC